MLAAACGCCSCDLRARSRIWRGGGAAARWPPLDFRPKQLRCTPLPPTKAAGADSPAPPPTRRLTHFSLTTKSRDLRAGSMALVIGPRR